MSIIRWEDPPAHGSGSPGRGKQSIGHELIAVQLRRKPGEWALIYELKTTPALATEINQGKLRPYQPAGTYEAVSRQVDGLFRVYARYIGQVSDA